LERGSLPQREPAWFRATSRGIQAALASIDSLTDKGAEERVTAAKARFDHAADKAENARDALELYDATSEARSISGHRPAGTGGTVTAGRGPRVECIRDELTYRPDVPDISFHRDAFAAQRGDSTAIDRLGRNQ
jgi:hypothetical protein